jgi:hypothetical protein
MKTLRILTTVWMCCIVLCLPACSLFTPQQRSAAITELDAARSRGDITQAQHDAAVEAIRTDPKSVDWVALGSVGLNIMLGILGVPIAIGIRNRVIDIHTNTGGTVPPTPVTTPAAP